MLDMIYNHKVSLIVILLRPDEGPPKNNKWLPYLPQSNEVLKTRNYIITRTKYIDVDKHMIAESEYTINKLNDKSFNFKLLHYQEWPDNGKFI